MRALTWHWKKMELGFSQETAGPRASCAPTQFIWCFMWLKEQKRNISLKGINSVASKMAITMFSKMKKWYLAPCKWAKAVNCILPPYVGSRAICVFNKRKRFIVTNKCHFLQIIVACTARAIIILYFETFDLSWIVDALNKALWFCN